MLALVTILEKAHFFLLFQNVGNRNSKRHNVLNLKVGCGKTPYSLKGLVLFIQSFFFFLFYQSAQIACALPLQQKLILSSSKASNGP